MDYRLSYPAITGEPVTQGHADYCTENGHATHTTDGILSPLCPRCGGGVATRAPDIEMIEQDTEITVNYGPRTPREWVPATGEPEPLIIVSGGQWQVVNIRELAYAYEQARYSDEQDYRPEVAYFAQGDALIPARVLETVGFYDDNQWATVLIQVIDIGDNLASKVIASGTYRLDGRA